LLGWGMRGRNRACTSSAGLARQARQEGKGKNKTGGRLTTTSDLSNPRSGLIGTRSLVQVATHSHEPQGQHHRDAGMISEIFVLPTSGDVFEALLRRNSDILTDLPFSATNTVPLPSPNTTESTMRACLMGQSKCSAMERRVSIKAGAVGKNERRVRTHIPHASPCIIRRKRHGEHDASLAARRARV